MTDKKIVELLKSGNFTLYYHDSGSCMLFKGHKEVLSDYGTELCEFGYNDQEGYTPMEVELLVRALGGKVISI